MLDSESEIKEKLGKHLALRGGATVVIVRRALEYRKDASVFCYSVEMGCGTRISLGTVSEMLSFTKAQAAVADAYFHVVPKGRSRDWDCAVQLILDLYKLMENDYRQKLALDWPETGLLVGDEIRDNARQMLGFVRPAHPDQLEGCVTWAEAPIPEDNEQQYFSPYADLDFLGRPEKEGDEEELREVLGGDGKEEDAAPGGEDADDGTEEPGQETIEGRFLDVPLEQRIGETTDSEQQQETTEKRVNALGGVGGLPGGLD